jgi:uncharacterized protein YbaP (TraB family)
MNLLLRILLVLCLLAAGTCVGMVASKRQPAQGAAPSAGTGSASPGFTAAIPGKPGSSTAGSSTVGGKPVGNSPVPLLWKVSDGDNHIYLLGSFHALKPSDYPLAPSVDAAFDDAELVAFEISPEEMTSPDLGVQMMQAALDPEGGLQASLDPGTWARLQAYCKARGLPLETFENYEPWFVGLMISMTEMQRVGYDPGQGLDQQLIARAATAKKRTMGLESGASQIAVLDGMNPVEQRQSLAEALDDADKNTEIDQLHDLWRSGDAAALEQMLTVEFKSRYSSLYQRIDVDRNDAWVPKLQALLDNEKHDDAMIVVGTMHLLGPDGLVSKLKSKGYAVERVQ